MRWPFITKYLEKQERCEKERRDKVKRRMVDDFLQRMDELPQYDEQLCTKCSGLDKTKQRFALRLCNFTQYYTLGSSRKMLASCAVIERECCCCGHEWDERAADGESPKVFIDAD